MASIGTFTKSGDKYSGFIKTMVISKAIELVPVENVAERGPGYRVFCEGAEIGAAWNKTSQAQRAYISLTLDDPTFPEPMYASLVESDKEPGSWRLLWDRPKATSSQVAS